ncbi:MAG: hypothetical protein UX38_C0019G0006 [Microgenomates group bacterium GW2011_GWC1_46_16]|uniref:Uncharacterized protein n=2 Tax=Candidatus Collieribacteriota TaxID=1752725 RepID=A0A1F5FXU8_9BACT|nr:MAG: hypothetical protein UX32_C0008G0028 [Microgenomates group bacterium GW2011_GWF1_46_12]KKU25679.1 MAG: hypothetical protein UX38_C0019G0006 [Microgenomates group bacterium GW2011_GWC1_46_16]KKU27657.1 MAG: hypothetical protein UX40_C0009G0028 [Microgenomates group bacterium GW2011_GWF2_46_18]KKU44759.1 MAG: hypothetical protein UX63_C0023G0007 [Microgenomates group bacterium GW2011_GWB1_46_7]KKU61066.1 MAG: hypothetical protein UX82_C0005G0029 [Microgenomates group bacterium GW2011_GWE1
MRFCPKKEVVSELAVAVLGTDGEPRYFCPVVLGQMLAMGNFDFELGVSEPNFIIAAPNCSEENCATARAIVQNHKLSEVNVLNFGAKLPNTPTTEAMDPHGACLIHARKRKIPWNQNGNKQESREE